MSAARRSCLADKFAIKFILNIKEWTGKEVKLIFWADVPGVIIFAVKYFDI
jgi:hypothetical protein